ncbi:MAG: REP-associated tyrosine transposase [Gammaproteobacteria bacterium]
MNELNRCRTKGQAYFITMALPSRQSSPSAEQIRLLCTALVSLKRNHRFSIDALVILPSYMQCILTLLEGNQGFSRLWGQIISEFSGVACECEGANEALKNEEEGLRQKRIFGYPLRDDKDFAFHMDYLHYNPVNQGLVKRVSEWPYSTFFPYVQQGIYPLSWIRECV